ncbi:hypothetical protein, partial [Bradyrhizobium liaoningense]|uniref:hypothetical protein n=1 Tax=Bradyrhizobium liaoningense TaxID=43992 RepID=UPI001BAC008E
TVRIARSSWEQNGYERHRTRPVPVSVAGPERHPDRRTTTPKKFGSLEKVSRPQDKIFALESAIVNVESGAYPVLF